MTFSILIKIGLLDKLHTYLHDLLDLLGDLEVSDRTIPKSPTAYAYCTPTPVPGSAQQCLTPLPACIGTPQQRSAAVCTVDRTHEFLRLRYSYTSRTQGRTVHRRVAAQYHNHERGSSCDDHDVINIIHERVSSKSRKPINAVRIRELSSSIRAI